MLYEIKVFKGTDLNSVMPKVYDYVLSEGRESSPRGKKVIESKRPVVLDIFPDRNPWTFIKGRKLNPYFAIAEVIWILSGRKDVSFISYYNKNISQFSGDGIEFDGAYGDRLRNWPIYVENEIYYSDIDKKVFELDFVDQIALVCRRLKSDPNTRQAVLSLWDPSRDLKEGSKDYPCNNMCYFTLRNNILDMSVIRRSNDMIWGLPYNQIQFYFIHAMIAGEIGAEIGMYTEFVQNMHVYTENYPSTLELVKQKLSSGNVTESDAGSKAEMRISLSQFQAFKDMFLEIERDWRCSYPEIKSHHVRSVAEIMESKGIPEFWSRTMLYVPMAYIAKKRGNLKLHDFLVSQIDPNVLWLVEDANVSKEKL